MRRILTTLALLCAAGSLASSAAPAKSDPPEGWKLAFADKFEAGDAAAWEPTDAKAWKLVRDGDRQAYSLAGPSDYKPKVRSPLSYSLVKGVEVEDFELEASIRSTTKDYAHRDLCLFFGWQDASHFYYVHFARESDPHANSIFIVNGADRVSIAKTRTSGTKWTDDYHKVRLVRRAVEGSIEVYFDDMNAPAFTAQDKTFAHGRVGVGSFDDTGNFRDVKVWAPAGK